VEELTDEIADELPLPVPVGNHIARIVLVTFLLTFIAARVVVILIMTRRMPDLYLHLGGTHVHHLNYGIFLLSGVGAYLLFRRPGGSRLVAAAIVYGVGLALTFDEFGMWVHLGGSYWQRASYDAIVVIAAMLGLIAYAPALKRYRPEHWVWTIVLVLVVAVFFAMSAMALSRHFGPELRGIEASGPR
jgi:hypothetical protein